MTELTESIAWLFGSLLAGIGAFLSWFYESGLLGAITGVVIGAGITFFVQTRTQKRAWKREYALRNTEIIYGPLFQEVDGCLHYATNESEPQGFYLQELEKVKDTYHYLTIDDAFRNKLNSLSKKTCENSMRIQNLRSVAHNLTIEETGAAFPTYQKSFPELVVKRAGGDGHYHISESLISQERPEISIQREQKGKPFECFVALNPIPHGQPVLLKYEGSTKEIFDEMWLKCHQRFEEDSEAKTLRKEYPEIVNELKNVRKELVKRIQEPWKV